MTEIWKDEPDLRPAPELEADVLRLTTRLMMRERDLRQTKLQMTSQIACAHQLVALWKRRAEKLEEKMRLVLQQKDQEMQEITLELFRFQGSLKTEQRKIEKLFEEKDKIIKKQKLELARLKRHLGRFAGSEQRKTRECNQQTRSEAVKRLQVENYTAQNTSKSTSIRGKDIPKQRPSFDKEFHSSRMNINWKNVANSQKDLRQRAIQDVTNVLQTTYSRSQEDDNSNKVTANQLIVNDVESKDLLLKAEEMLAVCSPNNEIELSITIKENQKKLRNDIAYSVKERVPFKQKMPTDLNFVKGYSTLSMKGIKILSPHCMQL
ncbi:uncharacterized protein LOC143245311 [Tachypleus tridentatus]|uniref:uncharacterized protein LOC143245311 n=1 Tax=Tachypleus tridentatus TaxID=6853 RepID=UPI003FD35297